MGILTVKINPSSHAKLRELAEEAREPMTTILEKAIEEYRRIQFLRKANAAFARLRKDRKAWKEERKERTAWERTLADALEDE